MTEIFGTLGPACGDVETLVRMFENGMTGMRLNLSHTSLKESAEVISHFHEAAAKAGVKPDLLIDMQGPELRIGKMKDGLWITVGEEVLLAEEPDTGHDDDKAGSRAGAPERIPVPAGFLQHLDARDEVLLDDGRILLKVETVGVDAASCNVVRGGILTGRKSIKIVNKPVYGKALTDRDLISLKEAASYGVTSIMQPFVRGKEDLLAVRQALEANGAGKLRIFAKIENREGIRNLEEILEETDMLVIARGDLGNDMPLWDLPAVQKQIEAVCRKKNKPFLVVTQMLTSMIHAAVPTRAEVSDIFNAVADGASAVMVTNETAVGEYPVEVIRYLVKTAASAEKWMEMTEWNR